MGDLNQVMLHLSHEEYNGNLLQPQHTSSYHLKNPEKLKHLLGKLRLQPTWQSGISDKVSPPSSLFVCLL